MLAVAGADGAARAVAQPTTAWIGGKFTDIEKVYQIRKQVSPSLEHVSGRGRSCPARPQPLNGRPAQPTFVGARLQPGPNDPTEVAIIKIDKVPPAGACRVPCAPGPRALRCTGCHRAHRGRQGRRCVPGHSVRSRGRCTSLTRARRSNEVDLRAQLVHEHIVKFYEARARPAVPHAHAHR